jgi:hypothetical protein
MKLRYLTIPNSDYPPDVERKRRLEAEGYWPERITPQEITMRLDFLGGLRTGPFRSR